MIFLFIAYKGHEEWRFEASENAKIEDMVGHAMDHFRVSSDDEFFLEFQTEEGEWELARDDQVLGDVFQDRRSGSNVARMRLVRAS